MFKSDRQRKCVMAQLNNTSKSDKLHNRMKEKRENSFENDMEKPTLKDQIRDLREIREHSTSSDLQGVVEARSGKIMKENNIPDNKKNEVENIMINYADGEIDINTAQRYLIDLKSDNDEKNIYDEKGSSMDYFLGADPKKHKDYKHFKGE